jgi:V/A-type H+-transporting ATPase subunit C
MMVDAIARVRGLRGHLLGRRGVTELAAQPELAARLDLLRRAALVSSAAVTLKGALRELRGGVARDLARVDAWLGDTRSLRLLRAILGFADAWSLKTILRGVEHNEPPARLRALLAPTLELGDPELAELAAQRGARAVINVLASWQSPFAAPLLEAVRAARGAVDLPALESALDRFVHQRALQEARRRGGTDGEVALELLGCFADLANAATLLALAGRANLEELFLDGGTVLSRTRFAKLARLTRTEVHERIRGDRRLGLEAAFVDGTLEPFRLQRLVALRPLRPLHRVAGERPLSIAVPLLYLLERFEELRAVRLILEAGELGLPAHELVELVEVGA